MSREPIIDVFVGLGVAVSCTVGLFIAGSVAVGLAQQAPPPEATNIALCNAELNSAAADVTNLMAALRRSDATAKLIGQDREQLAAQVEALKKQIEDMKAAQAPKPEAEPQP